MTAYLEVAQELVASGYLNAADLHAAAAMLVEKMRIAVAKYQEAVATDDLVDQQNVIAEAEAEIAAATGMGNPDAEEGQREVIARAERALAPDRERLEAAREAIAVATSEAADALMAAGLVDASPDKWMGKQGRRTTSLRRILLMLLCRRERTKKKRALAPKCNFLLQTGQIRTSEG